MKQIFLAIALITISQFMFAQESPEIEKSDTLKVQKSDTIKRNYGKHNEVEIIKVDDKIVRINFEPSDSSSNQKKKYKTENYPHWSSFAVGMNLLMNENQNYTFPSAKYWEIDPSKSYSYSFNFSEKKISLYQNYIGITTGLGLIFNNYTFKNNYVLASTEDTLFAVTEPSLQYSKNKLKSTYLRVPLLLEFCASKYDDGFYLSAGVVGGVRLGSKTKREEKMHQEIRLSKKLKTITI